MPRDEVTSESPTVASQVAGTERFAGRYRVLGRLGRGASKEVYLAHDERLDRDVALALVVGASSSDAARERVRREAQVTGRLGDHPHIVTAYDAGEHDGIPYLVLRPMTGGSLAELGERPPVAEALRLGREIALALAHSHAHGIIHRDVKPDNVWLAADRAAALGDFGVARALGSERLTAEGVVVGTVRYLSPEQARGDDVGPASDLYSLGVTLYELLTGRTPFAGEDQSAVLAQHLGVPPEPPSRHAPAIPVPVERLVLQLLSKRPDERPSSAQAVAENLERLISEPDQVAARGGDFVGREAVMARLGAAWNDALAGAPRIVALAGEPGIGKTRCAQELARRAADAGAAVVWGLCADHEGAPPFWPWARALRDLSADGLLTADESSRGYSPEEARFRLFDAVAEHLERLSTEDSALVVLDDLHWADRSSLELLEHVGRELRRGRLLIILTYRDREARSEGPLRRALGELARRPAFTRLELSGLAPEEVARYVEHATGHPVDTSVTASLHRRTEGNPFFVGELVRLLDQDGTGAIPDTVRDVVGARIERLPSITRMALEAAAAAGRESHPALVARVSELSRAELLDALEPAAREHLIGEPEPGRLRFVHAIVRDVVYDGLSRSRRARLHAALGRLLERRRERGETQAAAEVAHHLLAGARLGADPEPALEASVEAAREASGRLAHAEAASHYEGALEASRLADVDDDTRSCRLLLDLARARTLAGDLDEAQRRYGEAATLARRVGSAELAEAALGYAEWQLYGVVDHVAIALLHDALGQLPDDDSATRAHLLGRLAVRLDPHGEQPRREALLDEAIAIARRLGNPATLSRLLALSPLIHWQPHSSERRRTDAAETIALARTAGDHEAALWAHTMRYVDAFGLGDLAAADAELDAYERLAGELRQPYYRWSLDVLRATRAIFAGRFEEGERLATEAVEHNRAHEPDSEQEYTVQMLMLAAARGRPEEAEAELLRRFAEQYPNLPMWRAIVAYVDCVRGDEAAARQGFEALARDDFSEPTRDPDVIATLSFAAETCAGLRDAPRAAILHELLLPYRDRNVLVERAWGAWGPAAHQLGLLAATTGDHRRAGEHFARALELSRRWQALPWEQRALRAMDDQRPTST